MTDEVQAATVNASREAVASAVTPRQRIGATLTGEVLEVGPGSQPFPLAPGAHAVYADRSVPGGRDENWPELAGAAWGPKADFDVDLDVSGFAAVADQSLDGVVASHVVEHLANPIGALVEFQRVLRPRGRLVLILPDRTKTFDWVREPTTFSHLLAEFRTGTNRVSDAHIREYCRAIYMQPSMHPPLVRGWHDPRQLDSARCDLHRRRSIHVHCWGAEDFASTLAGFLAEGVLAWRLLDLYVIEDLPDGKGIEFGLVLEKQVGSVDAQTCCHAFVSDWTTLLLNTSKADPARVLHFASLLQRDLGNRPALAATCALPRALLQQSGRTVSSPVAQLGVRRRLMQTLQTLRELPVVGRLIA